MKNRNFFALLLLLVAALFILIPMPHKKKVEYVSNEGKIHGTYYHVTYLQPDGLNLHDSIACAMHVFEKSLSVFDTASIISKINRNEPVSTDSLFEQMYREARQVSEISSGAFDITVAPLVNAWGFGFRSSEFPTAEQIDSLRAFVGFRHVALHEHVLVKDDVRTMLDAGAIAKGFSVDVIAALLERNGCENFLVEIGGEVVCRGVNAKGKKWSIGISTPEDSPLPNGQVQQVLQANALAMATSGNYRQFYWRDGKKYSHTIDPRTGYPVEHNLLSATVVAPTCMRADALATACMVLGKDSALHLCESDPDVEGYFIFSEGDSLRVVFTAGLEHYLK